MEKEKQAPAAPRFDKDRWESFGSRYTDASNTRAKTPEKKPAEKKDSREPVKPAPTKPAANWPDQLKAAAKGALLFGGLGLLFFYWQQTGLMDPAAAVPSMIVCALLAGLTIGRNTAK